LLQIANIVAQLLVVHLRRLPHFFLEVAGQLVHLRKRADIKLAEVGYGVAVERTLPSLFEHPFLQSFFPVSAHSIDSPRDLKGMRVQLKGRNAPELVAIGIVELVVVHFPSTVLAVALARVSALAENPPYRPAVGLRRPSFDGVTQSFRALVSRRQIPLVQ